MPSDLPFSSPPPPQHRCLQWCPPRRCAGIRAERCATEVTKRTVLPWYAMTYAMLCCYELWPIMDRVWKLDWNCLHFGCYCPLWQLVLKHIVTRTPPCRCNIKGLLKIDVTAGTVDVWPGSHEMIVVERDPSSSHQCNVPRGTTYSLSGPTALLWLEVRPTNTSS